MQSAPYSPAGRRSAQSDILPFGGPAIERRSSGLKAGILYDREVLRWMRLR